MKFKSGFFILIFSSLVLLADSGFSPGQAKITASVLNVRNIASQGGSVVDSLKRGDLVQVAERSINTAEVDGINDYWYKVALPKGKAGWVFGAYITFELNLEHGLRWKTINPASNETFTGIVISPDGAVMAGTNRGNVYSSRDKGKTWKKVIPQALGNTIENIKKIVLYKKDLWIASNGNQGGGVWKSSNNGASWSQYTTAQGLSSNVVNDLHISADGKIWAATTKGIDISENNGSTWKQYGSNKGLEGEILCLTSAKGRLIVGTTKGLFTIEKKSSLIGNDKDVFVRLSDNINNRVESIHYSENTLFAGTDSGLLKGNVDKLTEWIQVGGSTKVQSIFIDERKRIIVATVNGLNISLDNGDSWVTYKKEHGLGSNNIGNITVDNNQIIWLTLGASGLAYHE